MNLSFQTVCELADGLALIDAGKPISDEDRIRIHKRHADINAFGWLRPNSLTEVSDSFREYLHAWHAQPPDILKMNEHLRRHQDYANFLDALERSIHVNLPTHNGTENVRGFERGYAVSKQVSRICKGWALPLGQAFIVPAPEDIPSVQNPGPGLVIGNNWGTPDKPGMSSFHRALESAYAKAEKTSGYANLGRLMPDVCETLTMSYQGFWHTLTRFVRERSGTLRLAPATCRRDIDKTLQMTLLRSRLDIQRKRLSADLQGHKPLPKPRWTETHYLVDGLLINGIQAKLIRFR